MQTEDGRGLGRKYVEDRRDLRFSLPESLPGAANVRSQMHFAGAIIDQGRKSKCVGSAFKGWLYGGPIINKTPITDDEIYARAQDVDEWAEKEPEMQGTSIRAGAKVLRDLGFIESFRWALSVESVIDHLAVVGPMVAGTIWTRGMSYPDKDGYARPDGRLYGGHGFRLVGMHREVRNPDQTKGRVRIANSHGYEYGQRGRAWISFRDLEVLLKEHGEMCLPIERLVAS